MPSERYQGIAGDRVQLRSGVTGIVLTCRRKDGQGTYLKVKLTDGRWVWPNEVIAESSGTYTARCGECVIEFLTDAPNASTCPNCVARERRAQRPDRELVGSSTFSRLGRAPAFTPAPAFDNATTEQRERIDRGRVSDDEGVPF